MLTGHSGRSPMTCLYRCGNACDHPVPNESDNAYFGDLANSEVSRRGFVRGSAAGALVLGLGAAAVTSATPAFAHGNEGHGGGGGGGYPGADPDVYTPSRPGNGALTFKPIPPNDPNWDRLQEAAKPARNDPRAFLELHHIFGDLAQNPSYVRAFSDALSALWARGVRSTLADYLSAKA